MFHSLFGNLVNHLYHYANENVSIKHLSLICITSILTTAFTCSKTAQFLEDLAVFTALNHDWGSFGKNLVKFKKKCYLPAKGRSVW